MTYPEIEKAAREKAVVIFPAGVIEEHGPHLPLEWTRTKATLGEASNGAEKRGIQALIAPPFYWGSIPLPARSGSFNSREKQWSTSCGRYGEPQTVEVGERLRE
jgi:creatinine amidohydrolase/Fe(II)-dependent formamide hydrolase-like protein